MKAFNFHINSSKIHISLSGGFLADLADAFTWVFKSIVVKEINNSINKSVPASIEKSLNGILASTHALAYFNDHLAFDFSFTSPAVISDTQMALYLNSSLYDNARGYQIPSSPVDDLQINTTSKG